MMKSLPVRERGLKSYCYWDFTNSREVAPRAGAWIEIEDLQLDAVNPAVAPRAGAWIEILLH